MRWNEAKLAMQEGKHIRHKGWRKGLSWYMDESKQIICRVPYFAKDIYQYYPVGAVDIRWAKVAKWELQ